MARSTSDDKGIGPIEDDKADEQDEKSPTPIRATVYVVKGVDDVRV